MSQAQAQAQAQDQAQAHSRVPGHSDESTINVNNKNENARKTAKESKKKEKRGRSNKDKNDDKDNIDQDNNETTDADRSNMSVNARAKRSKSRTSRGKSKEPELQQQNQQPPPQQQFQQQPQQQQQQFQQGYPPQFQQQPPPQQQQYQAAPPPPPPASDPSQEDVKFVDESPSQVSSAPSTTVVNAEGDISSGYDPNTIHKILSKIHFPAMHPMFLAENVAPAVLPTHLLSDYEMDTIFIDCLSRSPDKFGLFPSDKRSITPLLSVRPLRSTERPFTIEFNPRDRIHKELRQRILLVSGLPPDRYLLKSENPETNRLLQEAAEGATVGDVGLKEGDKIDLVQTIRVKVVGPLSDDYRTSNAVGCGAGCTTGCSGASNRQRNTLGTLDVMETDKMRDLKPKVQRVLENQGLSVDGLVFKSHGDDVRDSAAFIECRLDAQGYETGETVRPHGSGFDGGCSAACTGKPQQQPLRSEPANNEPDEFCGMSNCDEKRCRGACKFPSPAERNRR